MFDLHILAESYALRAYDAVQLAAVAELHALRTAAGLPAVTLVSADQEHKCRRHCAWPAGRRPQSTPLMALLFG